MVRIKPGLPDGEIRSFWVNNGWAPTDIWALTYGNIYHMYGDIWFPVAYYSLGPTNPYFNCLVGVTDSTENAILVGTNDGIARSTDGGLNWVSVDSGLTNTFVNSMFVNDDTVFAGTNGGIFRSTNKGTIWIPVNNGLSNTSVNCFAEFNQHLFSGTKEGIFKSTNNGENWTMADSGLQTKLINSIAVSGENIIAGTENGMYLSTNTGLSWTILNSGFPDSTAVYCFTVRGSSIFAGTQNGVFLSTNNGINWTNVDSGLTDTVVYSIAISGKDIFAATHGIIIWSRSLSEMGITSVKSFVSMVPNEIVLNQNFPNPFNPSTLISYKLASISHVIIKVIDVLGREVKTLVNERQNVGDHSVTFNASNLSNGVYFYKLQVGNYSQTRKLMVIK